MQISRSLRIASLIFSVIVAVAVPAFSAGPARRLVLSDFEDEEALKQITLAAMEVRLSDQHVSSGRKSLEIVCGPFEKNKYQWPRVELGPKFLGRPSWDLSHYSKLKAQVTNPGAESVRLLLALTSFGYFDRFGSESVYEEYLIPAGNTMTVEMDLRTVEKRIRANSPFNLSAMTWLQFRFGPAAKDTIVLRLDNLSLEYDPAYGSPMASLRDEIDALTAGLGEMEKRIDLDAKPGRKETVLKQREDDLRELNRIRGQVTQLIAMVEGIDTEVYAPEAQGHYPGLRDRVREIKSTVSRLLLSDKPVFYAWLPPPYATVVKDSLPDITVPALAEIKMPLAKGEYGYGVFGITENGGKERTVTVSAVADDPALGARLGICEAYSARPGAVINGDAFFKLEGPLALPAGETRPVQITVDNRDRALSPGTRNFTLILKDGETGFEQQVPGTVVVRNISLPAYDVLPNNSYAELCQYPFASADTLLKDMRQSGLNVIYYLSPYPAITAYDKQTHKIAVDAEAFKQRVRAYLDAWGRDAKPTFIFGVHPQPAAGITLPAYPSPEWNELFKRWITSFVIACTDLGLDHADWLFVFGDEAGEDRLVDWEIPVAELVKAADPKARCTTNSSARVRDAATATRYFQVMDVFQPHLGQKPDPELYAWLKRSGKAVWFYRCSWSGDLYDDYRVFLWETIKYGGTGTGVWTYCSQGGRGYYDPTGKNPSGCILVYPHPVTKDCVIPTKRYLTYRDGLDDYRYVQALLQLGNAKGRADQAKSLVDAAVADVLSNRSDTTRADRWRRKIADAIEEWSKP